MKVRKSEDRGHVNHGWLDARHSFSFASYYDPKFTSYGKIRVMNEDRVKPKAGFPMHSHSDMEILTYIISGSLEHKDSMGNVGVIKAGEFQRMTAGKGIQHSEYNPSEHEETHLYQIWIEPREKSLSSSYEQHLAESFTRENGKALIVSSTGREGSMKIEQDLDIYHYEMKKGQEEEIKLQSSTAWLQIVTGRIEIDNKEFSSGDGIAFENNENFVIKIKEDCQVIFFDLN